MHAHTLRVRARSSILHSLPFLGQALQVASSRSTVCLHASTSAATVDPDGVQTLECRRARAGGFMLGGCSGNAASCRLDTGGPVVTSDSACSFPVSGFSSAQLF